MAFGARGPAYCVFVVQKERSGPDHLRVYQTQLGGEVGKLNVRKDAAHGPRAVGMIWSTGNRLFRFGKLGAHQADFWIE